MSKSNLIAAIHNMRIRNTISAEYFPSYEIMMDELEIIVSTQKMLHPSQVAIDYIWKRFKETTVSETAFLQWMLRQSKKSLQH
jgi:hypothetical protein